MNAYHVLDSLTAGGYWKSRKDNAKARRVAVVRSNSRTAPSQIKATKSVSVLWQDTALDYCSGRSDRYMRHLARAEEMAQRLNAEEQARYPGRTPDLFSGYSEKLERHILKYGDGWHFCAKAAKKGFDTDSDRAYHTHAVMKKFIGRHGSFVFGLAWDEEPPTGYYGETRHRKITLLQINESLGPCDSMRHRGIVFKILLEKGTRSESVMKWCEERVLEVLEDFRRDNPEPQSLITQRKEILDEEAEFGRFSEEVEQRAAA